MKANTSLLGLLMLVAGAVVLFSSWSFSPLPNQSFGSDTMPRLVGIFGLAVGLALVMQAWKAGERAPRLEVGDWAVDPRRLGTIATALMGVVAYILLSDILGFLPVAFLLLICLMLLRRTNPILAIVVALIGALAVQQAFGRLLLVPLPRSGFLEFLW
jgi:putative tricarboxylic transport membrane protein